jgi:O-antigen/teichoic acid export membrane protein
MQSGQIKATFHSLWARVYTNISGNPMLKGIFLIGGGSILAQMVGILSTPIITRLFSPEDFGLFAVYLSITSVITIVASLRYELAIPIPRDEADASNLFGLCLLLVATTSSILAVLMLIFGGPLLSLIGANRLGPYLWLLVPVFFIMGIYQVFLYWTIRRRNYGIITYTKIYQSFGGAISKIILGLLSAGPWGLLIGDCISQICGIGTIISRTWQEDKKLLTNISLKGMRDAALEYKKFPLFSSSSAVINALAFQVPVLLISSFYGLSEAGLYSLSNSILFLPSLVIGSSIAQAYLGEVTEVMRRDENHRKKLASLYLSTTTRLAAIAIPLIGIIALVAPTLFPVVFGQKWLYAGVYCLPIAFVAMSNFIISPTTTLEIYGFNHWKLAWDILRTLSVIGCFLIGNMMRLSIMDTLWLYVAVMVVTYAICFIMNIKAISLVNIK